MVTRRWQDIASIGLFSVGDGVEHGGLVNGIHYGQHLLGATPTKLTRRASRQVCVSNMYGPVVLFPRCHTPKQIPTRTHTYIQYSVYIYTLVQENGQDRGNTSAFISLDLIFENSSIPGVSEISLVCVHPFLLLSRCVYGPYINIYGCVYIYSLSPFTDTQNDHSRMELRGQHDL